MGYSYVLSLIPLRHRGLFLDDVFQQMVMWLVVCVPLLLVASIGGRFAEHWTQRLNESAMDTNNSGSSTDVGDAAISPAAPSNVGV